MIHWKSLLTLGFTAVLVGCGGGGGDDTPPVQQRHLIQGFASGPGTVTPNAISALQGSTYEFTFEAYPNFILHGAEGCNGRLEGHKYTVGPVTGPCDLTAFFGRPPLELAFNTDDVETVFKMAFTRDEFTDVTTFGSNSNMIGVTSTGEYRFIAESNVAVTASDIATSPDGRYLFLALGGSDSDNYIVHQKSCGLVKVDRTTDDYECLAPDLIFTGFDSNQPISITPVLQLDPRVDEQGNWVGKLYFHASTYTVTGDCEFTGYCRVARDSDRFIYQLDLDGQVEAITPADYRVQSMHINAEGELFIDALIPTGDNQGYSIFKYTDNTLELIQPINSSSVHFDDVNTLFALDRSRTPLLVHAGQDGIERADYADLLRGPFGQIYRGPHGHLFNFDAESSAVYSILPPRAEPVFVDDAFVHAGLSHLGQFKAVYGDWFLSYMAEARTGQTWEQQFIMMINVVTGETRRLLLPLNLGLDQERSYGFDLIGDQLFAAFSRSYASQHWVQVVDLAALLDGADEEEVSNAAYFRWRGQLIAIDDVIDLRIPVPAPNHALTNANVIFDKALGAVITVEFSQAVERTSVEAHLQVRHASTHAIVPYLPVWLENTLHLVVSLDGFDNEQRAVLPADEDYYLSFGAGIVDKQGRPLNLDGEVYLD